MGEFPFHARVGCGNGPGARPAYSCAALRLGGNHKMLRYQHRLYALPCELPWTVRSYKQVIYRGSHTMKVLAGERGGLGIFSLAFLVLACMVAFFSGDMLLVLAVLSAMAGLLVLGTGASTELAPRRLSPSGRWIAAA